MLRNVIETVKSKAKQIVGVATATATTLVTGVVAHASSSVGITDVQPVIDAVTAQVSVTSVVGVLAAVMAICIGLVFMWWAIRKALRMIFAALRGGRASA